MVLAVAVLAAGIYLIAVIMLLVIIYVSVGAGEMLDGSLCFFCLGQCLIPVRCSVTVC